MYWREFLEAKIMLNTQFVPLQLLSHLNSNGGKLVDPANIQRLVSIFELEGCKTADWPVCVNLSKEQYRQINLCPEIDAQSLRDQTWPLLSADISLTCIQGRHRIAAGRKFLPGNRYWWHANLYLEGKFSTSFVSVRN